MLNPLITICGTTGVGKSKLAIDLALSLARKSFGRHGWHGARVINADAMQVYSGLDVITNKVTAAEMKGVEHLLMGFKQPGEQYVVGDWVEDSLKLIHETHERNEIPIVVGGTSYWIQHLIFPNRLAKKSEAPASGSDVAEWDPVLREAILSLPEDLKVLFEQLPQDSPSAKKHPDMAFDLHKLLTLLDPAVGQRWHWKDTRKVLHSLEIIKNAKRRASDIIAEQGMDPDAAKPRFRTLCFWLFAEPSVLGPRLDARVDQMVERGLLDEVRELRHIADGADATPQHDYSLGIYQSIGYKEFHEYLSKPHDDKEFSIAVERMKLSTRQYAKKQISWIRNKLLPAVTHSNGDDELVSFYLLDAAEVDERWTEMALKPAVDITERLLEEQELPEPKSLSPMAVKLLDVPEKTADPVEILQARKKITCTVCTTQPDRPFMIEEGAEWETHIRTKTHRRMAASLVRLQTNLHYRRAKQKDISLE
ncbi:tRNA isopentenyltransferase [Coprinopsis marcescibilis]|uniref:tRNA isopentenyltransferase n=1 Tax=Coprinopsis marcescibilis TaxID=230819 RepID=A0A5C3L9U3_COPMA|nr:tRNA isopentenyltransferase [Coprinopsis marcescibilis]